MEKKGSDRRGFFSRIAKLGLAGGISALLLGRLGEKTLIPPVQAAGNMVIDEYNYGTGNTYLKSSTSFGPALKGWATATTGVVYGVHGQSESTSGAAVEGVATATTGDAWGVGGVFARFKWGGCYG